MENKVLNKIQMILREAREIKPTTYLQIAKETQLTPETLTRAVNGKRVGELTELRLKHYLRKVKKEAGIE